MDPRGTPCVDTGEATLLPAPFLRPLWPSLVVLWKEGTALLWVARTQRDGEGGPRMWVPAEEGPPGALAGPYGAEQTLQGRELSEALGLCGLERRQLTPCSSPT